MTKENEELKHWLKLSAQNTDADIALEIRSNISMLSQGLITPHESHALRQEIQWTLEGKMQKLKPKKHD